jgi:hypothetical protein
MKTGGIVAIIFGVLNIIAGIAISADPNYSHKAGGKFGFAIGCFVLGMYLINRANQKKEEEKQKNDWNKNNH